ncbi:MAG: DUF2273 domain-containing protein [Christensenellales bacterium]
MKDFYSRNKNGVIGAAAGIAVALLIIFIGFWTTLLIALFAFIGLLFGRARDRGVSIIEYIKMIWPFK